MSNRKCPRAPQRGHRTAVDELNCPYCSRRSPAASGGATAAGMFVMPPRAVKGTLLRGEEILLEDLHLETAEELSNALEENARYMDLEESEATAVIRNSIITLGGGRPQDGPVSYKRLRFENCKIELAPQEADPFSGFIPEDGKFTSAHWGHVGGTDYANISYDMKDCEIVSKGGFVTKAAFHGASSAENCTLSSDIDHVSFPQGKVVGCDFGHAVVDVSDGSGTGDLGDQFAGPAPVGVVKNSKARVVVASLNSKIHSSHFDHAEIGEWGVEPGSVGSIYVPDGAVVLYEPGSTMRDIDGNFVDNTISIKETSEGEMIALADDSKKMKVQRDPDKTAMFPLFTLNQRFGVDHEHMGTAARNLFIDAEDGNGRIATNNSAALGWLHETNAIHSDGTVDRHMIPVAIRLCPNPA